MAKKGIGLYITDTMIYLCTKDKIYYEPVDKDIIIHNRIALIDDFYRYMNKIIKKNKLNDSILGKNIKIVELPNYLNSDKELLNSLLEKLSFNKIEYIKYNDLIKENTINLNDNITIVTIEKKNYLIDNELLDKEIINIMLKKSPNNIFYLIGSNATLNKAFFESKVEQLKIYTYSNAEAYIIEKIQKEID